MKVINELNEFAGRLNELCDGMGIPPKGQARQGKLATIFNVSQKGARKWLEGEGYPEVKTCVRIAKWGNVKFEWLMTGRGPKHDITLNSDSFIFEIVEAITEMDDADKQASLDFIQYKIERSDGLFASDKVARYVKMIEKIKRDMDKKNGEEEE